MDTSPTEKSLQQVIEEARAKINAVLDKTPKRKRTPYICPTCESTQTRYRKRSNTHYCIRCGHVWPAENRPSYPERLKTGPRICRRDFRACADAAIHLATLVCQIYHPGDQHMLDTWPIRTWAEIIARHLLVPIPPPGHRLYKRRKPPKHRIAPPTL